MDLAAALSDWTDVDQAEFLFSKAIGLFRDVERMAERKAVFWSNNQLGNGLYAALNVLVEAGVLERRDEPDIQYRWRGAAANADVPD